MSQNRNNDKGPLSLSPKSFDGLDGILLVIGPEGVPRLLRLFSARGWAIPPPGITEEPVSGIFQAPHGIPGATGGGDVSDDSLDKTLTSLGPEFSIELIRRASVTYPEAYRLASADITPPAAGGNGTPAAAPTPGGNGTPAAASTPGGNGTPAAGGNGTPAAGGNGTPVATKNAAKQGIWNTYYVTEDATPDSTSSASNLTQNANSNGTEHPRPGFAPHGSPYNYRFGPPPPFRNPSATVFVHPFAPASFHPRPFLNGGRPAGHSGYIRMTNPATGVIILIPAPAGFQLQPGSAVIRVFDPPAYDYNVAVAANAIPGTSFAPTTGRAVAAPGNSAASSSGHTVAVPATRTPENSAVPSSTHPPQSNGCAVDGHMVAAESVEMSCYAPEGGEVSPLHLEDTFQTGHLFC